MEFLNDALDFQTWTQWHVGDVLHFVDERKPEVTVSFPPYVGVFDEEHLNPFDYEDADCIFASREHFEKFCVDNIESDYDLGKYSLCRKVLAALREE